MSRKSLQEIEVYVEDNIEDIPSGDVDEEELFLPPIILHLSGDDDDADNDDANDNVTNKEHDSVFSMTTAKNNEESASKSPHRKRKCEQMMTSSDVPLVRHEPWFTQLTPALSPPPLTPRVLPTGQFFCHEKRKKKDKFDKKNKCSNFCDKTYRQKKNKLDTTSVLPPPVTVLTRSMHKLAALRYDPCGAFYPNNLPSRRNNDQLWQNTCLAQQASILWSSEEKRRFQLEYSDASAEQLEEIMRRSWEKMAGRDRLRYIQRAYTAMNDCTSRQTSHAEHSNSHHELHEWGQTVPLHEVDQKTFLSGTIEFQRSIIHDKLIRLQEKLTAPEYQKFIVQYMSRLRFAQARCHKLQSEIRVEDSYDAWKLRMDRLALITMFWAIEVTEQRIDELKKQRIAVQERKLAAAYETVMHDLIFEQKGTSFKHFVKSEALTDLLNDLNGIDLMLPNNFVECGDTPDAWLNGSDKNRTVATKCGAEINETGLEQMIREMSLNFAKDTRVQRHTRLSNFPAVPLKVVEDYLIGLQCGAGTLCRKKLKDQVQQLPLSEVVYLDMASRLYHTIHGLDRCCYLESPSCFLTGLLLHSKLVKIEQHAAEKEKLQQLKQKQQQQEPNQLHQLKQQQQQQRMKNIAYPNKTHNTIHGRNFNATPTTSVFSTACSEPLMSIPYPSSHRLKNIPTPSFSVCANSNCSEQRALLASGKEFVDNALFPAEMDDDGIYGIDTWLTVPINKELPRNSAANVMEYANTSCSRSDAEVMQMKMGSIQNSELAMQTGLVGHSNTSSSHAIANSMDLEWPWMYDDDQDEFNFIPIFKDENNN